LKTNLSPIFLEKISPRWSSNNSGVKSRDEEDPRGWKIIKERYYSQGFFSILANIFLCLGFYLHYNSTSLSGGKEGETGG
jgi:hypothetical protein